MGDSLPEVIVNLTRARNQLLSDSQQAASRGDWSTAKTLMEQAERADRLREEVSAHATHKAPERKADGGEPPRVPEIEEARTTLRRPSDGRYPKYLVRGDALVKQGLQRGGNDFYEHSVPQERFKEILGALGKKASACAQEKQRPFSIAQIQRVLDCPPYMTYVAVSMLVRTGLLVRARKGSYTFAAPATFATDAAALWDHLKGADTL